MGRCPLSKLRIVLERALSANVAGKRWEISDHSSFPASRPWKLGRGDFFGALGLLLKPGQFLLEIPVGERTFRCEVAHHLNQQNNM